MINFKEFRKKIDDIKSRKVGLQHPENIEHSRNQQRIGRELNSVSIPLEVQDELDGKKGRHSLRPDENGNYKIEKGDIQKN